MSKTFRAWSLDQALLLPPSVHDFVPAGHLSRFVVALVTEELDLSAILASYRGEKGQPPYHPAMMVALLLYAYAVGIYSSRRIAKACVERVDFHGDRGATGASSRRPRRHRSRRAQRNFTDPESRIMKSRDGYIQGYNAQAAVDAEAQIIVGHA